MERDYPPIPASCVKNLVDKLFEKRKLAAVEIERIVKDSFNQEKLEDIVKMIGYFTQDFIMSLNPHTRKGGLLGLAAITIGLKENAGLYYKSIMPSIIQTFHDNDARVRYYACETLYNVMKITRKQTVTLLNEVFDAVCRTVCDPDMSVRQGALQCDRLLKEIVTELDSVDLSVIVFLLRERIYTTNPHARQFIVSWTTTLYAIPGVKISTYLPQLLDGLFRILGDPNPDIRRQCEILLHDLLSEITNDPKKIPFDAMINSLIIHCKLSSTACALNEGATRSGSPRDSPLADRRSSASIVMNTSSQSASIIQASVSGPSGSAEQLQQRTALTWILTFVELDREHLLPFASSIIGAVLPCFSVHGTLETARDRRTSLETAVQINETLMGFVGSIQPSVDRKPSSTLEGKILVASTPEKEDRELNGGDTTLNHITVRRSANATSPATARDQPTISTDAILEANFRLLDHHGLLTRLAAIRWLEILARVRTKEVLAHVIRRLPVMLNLLADPAADVVHSVIRLLGSLSIHPLVISLLDKPSLEALNIPADLFHMLAAPSDNHTGISSFPLRSAGTEADEYATRDNDTEGSTKPDSCNLFGIRFLVDLVGFFDTNATLLFQRGDAIITDLCHVLGADIVYGAMSAIISHTTHLRSASILVRALNRILLTQPALHEFRNQLRAINTKTGCHLLGRLYRAWCHNPVALLSLFMLTEMYEQCSRLIKSFSEISMTVDTFIEMDQLVQLLESPIFATLRMHLLDKRYSAHLRETLYCLLMCLPQTDAFQTLWRRVQCIPPTANLSDWQVISSRPQPDFALINSCIKFDALFDHFHALQQQYAKARVGPISSVPTASKAATTNAATMPLLDDALQSQNNASVAETRDFDSLSTGLTADYFAQSLAKLGIHIPEQTLLHNAGAITR